MAQRVRHDVPELHGGRDRLGDEVERAELERLLRSVERPVTGDHHPERVGAVLLGPPHQVEAAHSGHFQVAQDDVDLRSGEDLDSLQAVFGLQRSVVAQNPCEGAEHGRVVIDDQGLVDS